MKSTSTDTKRSGASQKRGKHPQPLPIHADRVQIEQIIVSNAAHTIYPGMLIAPNDQSGTDSAPESPQRIVMNHTSVTAELSIPARHVQRVCNEEPEVFADALIRIIQDGTKERPVVIRLLLESDG